MTKLCYIGKMFNERFWNVESDCIKPEGNYIHSSRSIEGLIELGIVPYKLPHNDGPEHYCKECRPPETDNVVKERNLI